MKMQVIRMIPISLQFVYWIIQKQHNLGCKLQVLVEETSTIPHQEMWTLGYPKVIFNPNTKWGNLILMLQKNG